MSLTFGGKLNFSGKINISAGTIYTVPPAILQYVMGNSVSFNGQGLDLNYGSFSGLLSNSSDTNYIFDTSADYANGSYGNIGYYYNGDLTPSIPNTFPAGNTFVNKGPLSYVAFNGLTSNSSPGTGQYIDSNPANDYIIPAGSSYTLFSVVRVNNFGTIDNPGTWTGGIVGGDQSLFGFVPAGVAPVPSNYPILYASTDSLGPQYIVDYTTQFQTDTWYAVAVTYNTDTGTLKLYVNGVNTATTTGNPPLSANEPLFWGTWEGGNWFNGDLGVMTAWDLELSAGQIALYTNTYGAPYGVTSAVQNNDMPLQTYSQLYDVPGTYTFTVPAGVTSISTLGVGGGGSGSESGNPQPGGDTYIYSQWDQYQTNFTATNTGTDTNQLIFDCSGSPGNVILGNVAPGYLVTSTTLNDTYANVAIIQGEVYGIVTSIDTNDISNVVVNINKNIATVTGGVDTFNFLGQGILGAQGGPESSSTYTNGSTGPGPRAQLLIGDGGGRGGVIDYFSNDSLGGGGAGGYGISTITQVAFDPNQTYLYDGDGNTNTGVANTVVVLNNTKLTATASGNNINGYTATGTYPISPTDKVMFSVTQDIWAGTDSMAVGLCNYNSNIAYYPGGDTNSIGYFDTGVVYYSDNTVLTGLPTFPDNGQIIDLAVDRNNDLMWIRVDGGYWNGNVSADPVTGTGAIEIMQGTATDPNLYLMVNVGYDTDLGAMSINTSNVYPVPSGYTFIAGGANVGSTGGDGSKYSVPTNKAGQGNGFTGGTGGGGGGIYQNTGSGGGGTGLYGVGSAGARGSWVNDNTGYPPDGSGPPDNTVMATGGAGGSASGNSGTSGGIASMWAGGAGGYPGGGGSSGVDYYGAGNGGALAYTNDVTVTPGQTYKVIVGQGGYGGGYGNSDFYSAGVGGSGAVRIVWPGSARQFPGNNVGIDAAGPSSITIGASDFTLSNNSGITANIDGGYVISLTANAGSNIVDRYVTLYGLDNDTLAQDLTAMFRQAGMYTFGTLNYNGAIPDINQFNAYIFNVTWADSSTGKVRMSWDLYGYLRLSIINTTYNNWQDASPYRGTGNPNPVLGGTFSFPATFTPYAPLIESSGDAWC
jgi:hypothetical protein